MFNVILLHSFKILLFVKFCSATFDINDLQLQRVADHLKREECLKLVESLRDGYFETHHFTTGPSTPVSCIRLLQHWNTHDGRRQTFHKLFVKLRQAGHADLADQLSQSVNDETVRQVHKFFLDDPFTSTILPPQTPDQEDNVEPPESVPSSWSFQEIMEIIFFVCVAIASTLVVILCILKFCFEDAYNKIRTRTYLEVCGKEPADEEDTFFGL